MSNNFVYKIPKDASYVTLRNQNRMLYANYRIQQNNVQQGCQIRVALENGGVADADIIPKLLQGARETTVAEIDAAIASEACSVVTPAPAPAPAPAYGGSMTFDYLFGSAGSSILYPNDADLAIGTESFTIEWFQFAESGPSYPRPFSIGEFPTADIAVSYELGDFYFWKNGSFNVVGSEPPLNEWVHVAIVGTTATDIKVYVNGTLLGTVSGSYNFTNTSTALAVGNETNASTNAGAFGGRITNFRWVVGTAVYTSNFTPPSTPLTAITGTQLLLLASNPTDVVKDSSAANRTPTNTGVTYSTTTPF